MSPEKTLLELTQCIHFRAPPGIQVYRHEFLTRGVVMTLWKTDRSRELLRELAETVRSTGPRLATGDVRTFSGAIDTVIGDRLMDPRYFNVPVSLAGTLFDALTPGSGEALASVLWREILSACEKALGGWLTIYPLRKVATSGALVLGNVRLLPADDGACWAMLRARFKFIDRFKPQFGFFDTGGEGYGFKVPVAAYLVAENSGSSPEALEQSARLMRRLLAVIVALRHPEHPNQVTKSAAEAETSAFQLSDGQEGRLQFLSIGEIFPPLLNTFKCDVALLAAVGDWHRKCDTAGADKRERAHKAAEHLHRAFVSDRVAKFLNAFIVLDSLFGERNQVKARIVDGAKRVFPADATWPERAALLFELRSTLAHGVIAEFRDWARLPEYTTRFKSDPTTDAWEISTTALANYFDLP